MNRYTNTRPDPLHLGSEYQTAASYLRRGSKLAVGTAERGAHAPNGARTADEVQQTGGDAAPVGDTQRGEVEAVPAGQR